MGLKMFRGGLFTAILVGLFVGGCNLRIPACAAADLAAPTLSLPADGDSLGADYPSATVPGAFNIAFDWNYPFSTCAPSAYRVDISDTDTFADISLGFGTLDGTETAAKWQLFPGCYYWRVAAYTNLSDEYGPVSEARRFCIAAAATPAATPALGSISGWVYVDSNDNNDLDAGDGKVQGARLTLRTDACPGTADLAVLESDLTGRYTFPGLIEGTYCIATWPLQGTLDPEMQDVFVHWGEALDDVNFHRLPDFWGAVTATFTATLTPTLTPTAAPPQAKAKQDLNCRLGPSPKYAVFAKFPQGEIAPIDGRNEIRTWWWINLKAGHCWVWDSGVETLGDVSRVPVVDFPPEPTNTPVVGCWVAQKDKTLQCIAPCPAGAKPGGMCTL